MGRVTEFRGRKTSGNNENETMINEKIIIQSRQKLKFSEFDVFLSFITQYFVKLPFCIR